MIIPWVGLTYSNSAPNALKFAGRTYYWLYAFVIASLPLQERQGKILIKVLLGGLFATGIICLMQFSGIFPLIKEAQFGFINPITYILLLVFGMLVLSFCFSNADKIKHRIYLGSGILLYFLNICLYLGAPGRTAYLVFILMSPLMTYYLLGRRHILRIALTGLLVLTVLFLSPIFQDPLRDTIEQIRMYNSGNPNTSVGLRLHMWRGAVQIFSENPILGVGTGGYQVAMKKYETPALNPEFREFTQPHNSFLYMAANFGIVGVVSLCWVFFVVIRTGWRHRKNLTGFSILSFGLIVFIGSFTDTQILQIQTAILFALFTGLQKGLDEVG